MKKPSRGAEMACGAPVFADVAEMLEAVRPDLVDITTPPATHAGMINAVAPHCPWIICQKPFCGDLETAR